MKTKKSIPWWRKSVIYQIYPFSFMDSNGDGIGDLEGIIQKLDYLNDGTPESLGVDAIWISPIYPSPWKDYGYDISHHTDIHLSFGNLVIFDRLVKEAHSRGIKIILDFVPNHTSSQHPWFIESRSSRTSTKRGWYIWHDSGSDGGPPTLRQGSFGGSAWTKDKETGQYYYHNYLPEQPDLNWRNKEVCEAMFHVFRFWLDRGVDGFRFDAVAGMIERNLHMGDRSHGIKMNVYAITSEELHNIFCNFRNLCDQYGERVMIGETWAESPGELARYYGKKVDEFHIPFNFFLIERPWNAQSVRDTVEEIEHAVPDGAWPNYVLGNHDLTRLATRYGRHNARLAAMLLLTLRGTPTLYYGDEIGMCDVDIAENQIRDPAPDRRDPERTPMQWDDALNAGFSSGEPWLPLGNDYKETNVAKQLHDPTSLLSLYRRLIWLRKQNSALCLGTYQTVDADNPNIFAYIRRSGKQKFLVVLNFSGEKERAVFNSLKGSGSIIISTRPDRSEQVLPEDFILSPYEGCVIKMR